MDFLKNFDGKKIPWWLVGVGFLISAPLALVLLLVKLFAGGGQSTAMNEPSLQQYAPMQLPEERVDTRINKAGKVDTRINKKKTVDAAPEASSRPVVIPPNPKKISTAWMKVVSVLLGLVGLVDIGDEIAAMDISGIATTLAFILGGLALGFKAFKTDRDQKRYAAYLPIVGEREAMSLDDLSRVSGTPRKQVVKDLQAMLELNYFGNSAYLNQELGYLFKSTEADAEWQERHAHDIRDETPAEVSEGYSGILRDIRRANDRIADPVLSAKIDRLEDIVGRILRAMEEDPEKAKRMDTFMTYYLPTTQKLLDSYARFEAAGVEGDNLRESKQRISATMDMILKGFSHQLDELYKTDAMDINSDIRVMETMLKRDAGSVSDDFGLGGSAAQKAPWETQ